MNNLFTLDFRAARRLICTMMAALLVVAGLPMVTQNKAYAAQFTNRSIQLSDSSVSGTSITTGVGSGTNVTYQVSFTPSATGQAESLVIDFCSQNPIINDTCTTPTSMSAASATVSSVSGNVGGTGWTITPTAGRVKLANDGNTAHDALPSTQQIFRLSGITNPSTVGTFYARIYSFANNSWGTYASATSAGNFLDYGGIALSTTTAITITARVQESLMFCVTASNPTAWTAHDCSDTLVASNPPALVLGHGSPTAVLDSSAVDVGSIYSQLSTNATSGAVINIHNSNTSCGGLSANGGTTCAIPPINSGSNAGASAMTAGTAAFGLFVSSSTADPSGGVGTITPSSIYHNNSHVTVPTDVWYGMDTATALGAGTIPATYTGGVTSTFGSTIASASAPVYRVENTYTFAATAALTTPAGIYTANLSMIATGSF
jgi:hypothetical protein